MAAVRLFEEQGYEQTTVAEIAAVADVDPKTFFNYFRSKDEVLFNDAARDFDVLFEAIAERRPDEGPGEVLARAVQAFAAHRRPKVPRREPAELSAAARLALTTPALQAKGLYRLDPITAAAMTGAVIGAIQQAGLASVQLGRSQDELWDAARRGLDVALHGLVSVRPTAGSPDPSGERTSSS
ncbi:helix-turn-helix domain-containing protein [Saccharopolyspora shandongensis]|uniref:TetR/AcrR family transcriptional regulator n=1 Tax=Saccharopolyspora shandongensis TaxID=418495 RepID=UPI0033D95757